MFTADGGWLDPRFGRLIAALTGHTGASRAVLTSRTASNGLDNTRVDVLPIAALTRDEALLLARELLHLRALQHDTEPTSGTLDPQAAADRAMLTRTLAVVGGHPKLLEVADTLAADLAVLQQLISAAESAATPTALSSTASDTGQASADPDRLLVALTSDPI